MSAADQNTRGGLSASTSGFLTTEEELIEIEHKTDGGVDLSLLLTRRRNGSRAAEQRRAIEISLRGRLLLWKSVLRTDEKKRRGSHTNISPRNAADRPGVSCGIEDLGIENC